MDLHWGIGSIQAFNYDIGTDFPSSQNTDLLLTSLMFELWGLPIPEIIEDIAIERDPVGDINLRAFSQDHENIQRATIQSATRTTLAYLMEQPLGHDQETVKEICEELIGKYAEHCKDVLFQLGNDIFDNVTSFGYSYAEVLDHVWAIIRNHEHKQELIQRFYEEVENGIDSCANGKMCHLMNVLQGFDERVTMNVSKDAFQSKMASLTTLPAEEREQAAKQVMDEYSIPENEREEWISALLEH